MAFSPFKRAGDTSDATIDYGVSAKFSEAEIKMAVDAVLIKFKDFKECSLMKLWYDEMKSDLFAETYMLYGLGAVNGVKRENVVILFSEFYVGNRACVSLGRNSVIAHPWHWTLIRESETCEWVVDGWGY